MKSMLVVAVIGLFGGPVLADPVRSGLQPGEQARSFTVRDITGPSRGKSLCYACQFARCAVVNIQTRELTPELAALVKQLDALVAPPDDDASAKRAFVVLITDDLEFAQQQVKEFADNTSLKHIPLTVYDGFTGPEGYSISRDAEVTIMMWSKSQVVKNFAFDTAELDNRTIDMIKTAAKEFLAGS